MMTSKAADTFRDQWLIYDFPLPADNPSIRIDAKYDTRNIQIKDGELKMKQLAFKSGDKHISISGIQSHKLDIGHGTFRTVFNVRGADGGSCAGFFWYRDDATEVDIEMVTKGNSFVNDTINYTTQPSRDADGNRIFNSTLSLPLSRKLNTDLKRFHEHRFDVATDTDVQYMLDGKVMHSDSHHTPTHDMGGNLQMKLWADGNRWWSGYPSSTDVTMSIKSIVVYYNTSSPETSANKAWTDACNKAGGPSQDTICRAFAKGGKNDDIPLSGKGKADTPTKGDNLPSSTMTGMNLQTREPTACFDLKCRQTLVGQALRVQPPGVGFIKKYLGSLPRLDCRYHGTLSISDATSSPKLSPVISAREMYSPCASCSTVSSTASATSIQINGTESLGSPTNTPCFDKKCMQPISQASRTQSPFSRLISSLPTWNKVTGWLARRDDVVYRLPGGSPVHVDENGQAIRSAAVRGRAPPWFFTDYTALLNSTRSTYQS